MPKIRRTVRRFRNLSIFEYLFIVLSITAGVVVFFQHFNSAEYNISEVEDTADDIVIRLRVEEIDRKDVVSMSLEAWKKEYVQRFNIPLVSISLDYIYISPEFLASNGINQVCFSKLNLLTKGENPTEQILAKEGLCNSAGVNYFVNQSTNFATFLYNKYEDDYIDPYFYPFDKRSILFSLSVDARLLDVNNEEMSALSQPSVGVKIVSQRGKDFWVLENIDRDELKLTLHRPIMYPALSILMIPVIFIAILSLLFLVDDKKDEKDDDAEAGYWEVAVGILGIWSIQEVLLPSFIEGPTIVGDIILSLYIFLSLIILFIFARSALKRLPKRSIQKSKPHKGKADDPQ